MIACTSVNYPWMIIKIMNRGKNIRHIDHTCNCKSRISKFSRAWTSICGRSLLHHLHHSFIYCGDLLWINRTRLKFTSSRNIIIKRWVANRFSNIRCISNFRRSGRTWFSFYVSKFLRIANDFEALVNSVLSHFRIITKSIKLILLIISFLEILLKN